LSPYVLQFNYAEMLVGWYGAGTEYVVFNINRADGGLTPVIYSPCFT